MQSELLQRGMPWNDPNHWMADPRARRGLEMLGAAVRRQRERRHWSQRDLQGMTGIDQSTISRLENGKRCGLRWSRFAVIVSVLGGLDFGDTRGQGLLGPMGLSPNPMVALAQLDEAEATIRSLRVAAEGRLTKASDPP